jgi:hypothetical protein
MTELKHVFTPQPTDGSIVSMRTFRGTLLVACDYALYQLTPVEGPVEWIIERISDTGERVPACVQY